MVTQLARTPTARAEDVSNIVSLEHVNTTVPDQSLATLFYIVGLGFTRDPYMNVGLTNMWVNIGEQQFHLPTAAPQVLRGHTGLVVPDLAALKERLASVAPQLEQTCFAWSDRGPFVEARSPWGNLYRAYAAGTFGEMRLGIPYIEFTVPRGAADGITRFYDSAFGAPGRVVDGAAHISVGTNQCLIYRESAEVPDYDGHHIAIYIHGFSGPYEYLEERGLITDGIRNHQFRFRDLIDPSTAGVVFQVEHEVRSTLHPGFRRQLVNRM